MLSDEFGWDVLLQSFSDAADPGAVGAETSWVEAEPLCSGLEYIVASVVCYWASVRPSGKNKFTSRVLGLRPASPVIP